ncbi:MAG: hypothetical protein A3J38_05950 [Gammaproteobacteria bacterium RIFCSPHIGHO2_12_FULL_45_9]|nr:MAG: hypothetical protein A3J38_05950 [Gammaproteobacteria bacterium RIFCSPHIGHO2_12_FULL_45_9]
MMPTLSALARDVYALTAAQTVRFQTLTHELRCLVCQGEDLDGSGAPFAADLKREIAERLRHGDSDYMIMNSLHLRYGDAILFSPPVSSRTWILWAAPWVILCVAGIIWWRSLQVRRKA